MKHEYYWIIGGVILLYLLYKSGALTSTTQVTTSAIPTSS